MSLDIWGMECFISMKTEAFGDSQYFRTLKQHSNIIFDEAIEIIYAIFLFSQSWCIKDFNLIDKSQQEC